MKNNYKKRIKIYAATLFTMFTSFAFASSTTGLIISEFMANPVGKDSSNEWVELKVTKYIDFSVTPYCVVFANNGTATANGWINGGTVTYGFNINSGVVNAGDVVYVGGSNMMPTGVKIRVIDTGTQSGDGFGNAATAGVLGNGGSNADAIAVFNMDISTVTATSVPIDAVFFGATLGNAVVTAGTAGYELPVNDLYTGGYLQTTSFFTFDPGSGQMVYASGTYDTILNTYTTARTWDTTHTATYDSSLVLLAPSSTVNVATLSSNQMVEVYPNPFKEQTDLHITLSDACRVKAEVFNVLGEKVETIADGEFSAGSHILSYNSKQSNQSAGIYFIKTIMGQQITVTRIVQQ